MEMQHSKLVRKWNFDVYREMTFLHHLLFGVSEKQTV